MNKDIRFKTSVATVLEIEVISQRDFGQEFSITVLPRLKRVKNLETIPLDLEMLEKSVVIRKKFGLATFDSLHAANCLLGNLEMVSTDPVFDRVSGLRRIDPRRLAA